MPADVPDPISSHSISPRLISSQRIWLARGVAVAADLVQIVFFPAFSEGFVSPLDVVVDIVVAVLLTFLIGWNIAFIPSFIIKAVPFADLAPTWTAAVLFATRTKNRSEVKR
jgi:hypothetical protein